MANPYATGRPLTIDRKTIKGVYEHPSGKFRAMIKLKGKQTHIGMFVTREEAIAACVGAITVRDARMVP